MDFIGLPKPGYVTKLKTQASQKVIELAQELFQFLGIKWDLIYNNHFHF